MPDPALPEPRPTPVALAGAVRFTRRYADALGRPMRGTVTLTPTAPTTAGGAVIPAAPVPVELDAGLLEVDLPPGTYRLSAALRTAEGAQATDAGTVTIQPA